MNTSTAPTEPRLHQNQDYIRTRTTVDPQWDYKRFCKVNPSLECEVWPDCFQMSESLRFSAELSWLWIKLEAVFIKWCIINEFKSVSAPILSGLKLIFFRIFASKYSTIIFTLFMRNHTQRTIPSGQDLQHALGGFAIDYEVTEMRVCSSSLRSLSWTRKGWNAPFRLGDSLSLKVEEFKCLGDLITSDGRIKQEMNWWVGALSSITRVLLQSAVVNHKANLCIYWSVFISALTYSHELCIMTDGERCLGFSPGNVASVTWL